jgi:hypothetical protein
MNMPLKIECRFHVERKARGRKQLGEGEAVRPACEPGRLPRVARLLALAHRFEGLVRTGQVTDYATLARLGQVTRARLSQIMALLNLAPDIQEAVLFLPRVLRGRQPIQMRHLLPIARVNDWRVQRRLWAALTQRLVPQAPPCGGEVPCCRPGPERGDERP